MKTVLKLLAGTAVALLSATTCFSQTAVPANVKGTPYLDEAYVNAEISFANNKRTVPVRYNAYKDLMEYQQNGQALVLDPSPTIRRVSLGDDTYVVEKYDDEGRITPGYFELLDTGKVTLYARKGVRFVPGKKGGALDGTDQPAEFKRTPDTYYFKVGDGQIQELKSVKAFIAALPDRQEELTQFTKKEKISTRKEEEVRQMVKYYNEL